MPATPAFLDAATPTDDVELNRLEALVDAARDDYTRALDAELPPYSIERRARKLARANAAYIDRLRAVREERTR